MTTKDLIGKYEVEITVDRHSIIKTTCITAEDIKGLTIKEARIKKDEIICSRAEKQIEVGYEKKMKRT